MYGLETDTIRDIKEVFKKLPQISKVVLYGSRAKGNYKNGSDIDITLFGNKLTLNNCTYPLMDALDELDLAYTFDISIFDQLKEPEFINHINRVGKVLYQQKKGLPKGWEIKKLVELGEIQTGTTPSTRNKEFYGDYIPFVKPPHFVSDGTINYENEGLSEIGLNKGRLIKENSILMVCIGATIGKTGITTIPVSCNQQINAFTPQKGLEPRYFYYLLNSSVFFNEVLKLSSQATLPMINKSKWQSIKVSYPKSLPEQQRIVAILDKAFTAIATAKENVEQNLLNAKELFESYLQGVFENKNKDWEVKTLGEVAEVTYGFTDKSSEEGDYRYVRITDIDNNGELEKSNKKYLKSSEEGLKFLLKNNDIVMARTGATFAKLLLYKEFEPSIFASYLIRIDFFEDIENEFYWYFSKSRGYWEQANNLSSGAAQPHFNGKALKKMVFSYPKSLKKQKILISEFKALQNETKKLEAIYQQKINDLEELKKSVLNKAFKGEL